MRRFAIVDFGLPAINRRWSILGVPPFAAMRNSFCHRFETLDACIPNCFNKFQQVSVVEELMRLSALTGAVFMLIFHGSADAMPFSSGFHDFKKIKYMDLNEKIQYRTMRNTGRFIYRYSAPVRTFNAVKNYGSYIGTYGPTVYRNTFNPYYQSYPNYGVRQGYGTFGRVVDGRFAQPTQRYYGPNRRQPIMQYRIR